MFFLFLLPISLCLLCCSYIPNITLQVYIFTFIPQFFPHTITVSFLLHLPLLSAILCTGWRDCSQRTGEEGDAQYVLPAGRHLEGPSVLRPGVGDIGSTQCQSNALQSPAAPSQQRVPAVCLLLWAVTQNQHLAGTSKAQTSVGVRINLMHGMPG